MPFKYDSLPAWLITCVILQFTKTAKLILSVCSVTRNRLFKHLLIPWSPKFAAVRLLQKISLSQNNQPGSSYNISLKALPMLLCMKNTALGCVSRESYSTRLRLVLYESLDMPLVLYFHTHARRGHIYFPERDGMGRDDSGNCHITILRDRTQFNIC